MRSNASVEKDDEAIVGILYVSSIQYKHKFNLNPDVVLDTIVGKKYFGLHSSNLPSSSSIKDFET